ncbi:MAG: ABC transporter permease [Bacteroidia bacterium]|nr:ABC transporter permease [Bacteroidia bacterium]
MERLKYFLRINIRNLFVLKKFAFVNIIGLSISLTISLLILIYVRYETSFDRFNPNARNIYRVVEKNIQDGSVGARTPLALSDILKKDYPEIDKVVGLMRTFDEVKVEEKRFENLKGAIVEKDFFELFNFPLKAGNQKTIFLDPFEIVFTTKLANKLFGKTDPIGKIIEYQNSIFTVAGVIDNIPSNSIFDFDYFLSDKFRYKDYPDLDKRWYEFGLFTFITFKGNKAPEGFETKLTNIEKKYYPDFMKNRHNYLLADFKGSHLNPSLGNDIVPAIAPVYLWILSAIALGILVIACLNFMNISIANASKRNIEIGIKKVNGATSGALIGDFFAEISVVVFISLIISFIGVHLLLPFFNDLIEKKIAVNVSDSIFWSGAVGFGILTTLISGLYPSIILSKPSPVKVLLQNQGAIKNKLTFQKSFVVLQFAITIILAITQLFIFKQISFMENHETGFNKENLIAMSVRSLGNNGPERMKNTEIFVLDLEKYQAQYRYGKATVTEFVPGFGYRNLFKIFPEGNAHSEGMELLSCDIDENFIDVFGLQIVQGRFFSKDFTSDSQAIIMNESAYKELGWKSVEGKSIGLFSKDNKREVVGVINDLNIKSLQHEIEPMIYQFGRHHNYPGYITVRLNPDKKAETIEFVKKLWMSRFPDVPFGFESIDEKYKAAYGEEEKLAKITGIFSIIAMLLSLLGIFALSTLESEKRIKEIGIRKVNGARISEVIAMLNKDFLKWVAIAFVIATPIAWYAMHKWLENFAYKTDLSWWIFALAGLLALGIALLTVSWQSWRAASRNPVEALRYE